MFIYFFFIILSVYLGCSAKRNIVFIKWCIPNLQNVHTSVHADWHDWLKYRNYEIKWMLSSCHSLVLLFADKFRTPIPIQTNASHLHTLAHRKYLERVRLFDFKTICQFSVSRLCERSWNQNTSREWNIVFFLSMS